MTISKACGDFYDKYCEEYELVWAMPAKKMSNGQWVIYVSSNMETSIPHISHLGYEVVELSEKNRDTISYYGDYLINDINPIKTNVDLTITQDQLGLIAALLSYLVPLPEYSKDWSELMDLLRIDSKTVSDVFIKHSDEVIEEIRPKNPVKFAKFSEDMGNAIVEQLEEEVSQPEGK